MTVVVASVGMVTRGEAAVTKMSLNKVVILVECMAVNISASQTTTKHDTNILVTACGVKFLS